MWDYLLAFGFLVLFWELYNLTNTSLQVKILAGKVDWPEWIVRDISNVLKLLRVSNNVVSWMFVVSLERVWFVLAVWFLTRLLWFGNGFDCVCETRFFME